jgi:PIN domain nuclease of toxin-antitoxin system
MRLLVDTHVILWWLANDERLEKPARDALAEADDALVSVASAWEVSIKRSLGRLRVAATWASHLTTGSFGILPIHLRHALHIATLPPLHADPFDRMLVAQAQLEGLTILTSDAQIAQYDVPTLSAR